MAHYTHFKTYPPSFDRTRAIAQGQNQAGLNLERYHYLRAAVTEAYDIEQLQPGDPSNPNPMPFVRQGIVFDRYKLTIAQREVFSAKDDNSQYNSLPVFPDLPERQESMVSSTAHVAQSLPDSKVAFLDSIVISPSSSSRIAQRPVCTTICFSTKAPFGSAFTAAKSEGTCPCLPS